MTVLRPQGFDSYTDVRQVPNSKEWMLRNALGYWIDSDEIDSVLQRFFHRFHQFTPNAHFGYSDLNNKMTVFAGFLTDFASVPRLLWSILSPDDIRRPAILHDAFYRTLWELRSLKVLSGSQFRKYRKTADQLFREAMDYTDPKISWWKKAAAYRAVRIFGGWSWAAKSPTKHSSNSRKPK